MAAAVWLIIPTYNEASNLERIVRASIPELERAAPERHRILVVDDNSPDGTGGIADRLADEISVVEVLHRTRKGGLGQAYLAGFAHALRSGADRVVEMDADFSHDPRYLPALIAAADQADLVLGSRYVAGGGVRDWGLVRRLVSRGGGIYARLILGVHVHDLTGGFKCIRREVLEAIDLGSIRAEGYVGRLQRARSADCVQRPGRRQEQDVVADRLGSHAQRPDPQAQRAGRLGPIGRPRRVHISATDLSNVIATLPKRQLASRRASSNQ